MENKVRFKLHKVKKHWITIAASSLAIGASLIGLGQVGADEVEPETTAVNSPEMSSLTVILRQVLASLQEPK